MHDPDVVVFDIKWPLPSWRSWRRNRAHKRVSGKAYRAAIVTVWHHEPDGHDSGRICKGMGGSDLTLHNVRWAWTHRAHLWLQWPLWQSLCRRIWTRCAECGEPFRRGQATFSHGWNGDGPGWKVRPAGVYHEKCSALVGIRSQRDEFLRALALLDPTEVQLSPPMTSTEAWRVRYAVETSVGLSDLPPASPVSREGEQ